MPIPRHSFNATNVRLAALTFILFFAVLWTFSLSTSDPSLNLSQPDDVSPTTPPVPLSTSTETTPTDIEDPIWPSPPAVNESIYPDIQPPPEANDAPATLPLEDAAAEPDLQPPNPVDVDADLDSDSDPTPPASPDQLLAPSDPLATLAPIIPPTDPYADLNPLPDPDLEQQREDGTSGIGSGSPPPPAFPGTSIEQKGTLIVYAYAESADARANLEYFLAKGLHGAADFIFIFNGNTTASELVPILPNVHIVRRENKCYDLGSFGEVLRKNNLWKKYSHFITMNASIRGPFLPTWSSRCWTDVYLSRVTETTKLVGMTVNCKPRPHVQSMILATDAIGMAALLDPEQALSASVDDQFGNKTDPVGFSGCYNEYSKAVHAEVGSSDVIRGAGYKVDALMTALHSETTPEEFCAANPSAGDVLFDGAYFGSNVHPYETVFIKANRNMDKKLLASMTEWHMKMNTTSFDTCGVA